MKTGEEWQDRFLVYFPSDDTAHSAHDAPENTAGTVCFQAKWWRGSKFPKQVLRDCISKKSVLMHNKVRSAPKSTSTIRCTDISPAALRVAFRANCAP